jgi:hypothetical protein
MFCNLQVNFSIGIIKYNFVCGITSGISSSALSSESSINNALNNYRILVSSALLSSIIDPLSVDAADGGN